MFNDGFFSGEVLCMGCVNMDLVMKVPVLPKPGETIITDNFNTYPGGKSGNQAVAASVFGSDVTMLTKLGDDPFSTQLKEALNDRGVKTCHIMTEKGKTSGIAMIWVDTKGQNSICFTPGANNRILPKEIEKKSFLFKKGSILLITMEIPEEIVFKAIRVGKENGMFVILNPAPAPKNKFPKDIPSMVDIITPNESETQSITGIEISSKESAEKGLIALNQMGFRFPVITMGEKGAAALVGGKFLFEEPLVVKTVDTTAAGDVFSGILAAKIAGEVSIESAIRYAKIAGALSTTKEGAQTSIPEPDEVERIYKEMM